MATEQNSNSAKLTRGDLEKMIGGMVEKAVSTIAGSNPGNGTGSTGNTTGTTGSNTTGQSSNGKSVAEQVRDALGQITKEREEKERNERIDEQLMKLQESNREKNPVERSWRHKLMGWGENEV